MKHFTRKYIENYSVDGMSKEQLRKDIQICSILLEQFEKRPAQIKKLNRVGAMAMQELFRRYGDYALWSAKYINNLPDSAFFWIDKESGRHLPYKDANGKIDIPHVRNTLSRLNQVKGLPQAKAEEIKLHVLKILDEMKNQERTFVKQNFAESYEVHSIDHMEMSTVIPSWLELSGILFHRGSHKGVEYDDECLINAKLVPNEGEKLCYVNFYHKRDESYRVGILAEIWWDPKVSWYCPTNDLKGKGALMYRSFVTDKEAIFEIHNKKVGNVSAELHFDTYFDVNDSTKKERAIHVQVSGKAITPTPALQAADIEQACTMDSEGNRSCQKLKNGKTK
jgi:hypothetical protein